MSVGSPSSSSVAPAMRVAAFRVAASRSRCRSPACRMFESKTGRVGPGRARRQALQRGPVGPELRRLRRREEEVRRGRPAAPLLGLGAQVGADDRPTRATRRQVGRSDHERQPLRRSCIRRARTRPTRSSSSACPTTTRFRTSAATRSAPTRAIAAFDELVRRWPTSEYAEPAKRRASVARDQLAGKEMQVGRFYLPRKDYTGAINRFRVVVSQYQTTRHVEEALHRLVEAYMALGIVGEAQTAAADARPQLSRTASGTSRAYALLTRPAARAAGEQRLVDQPRVPAARRRLRRAGCRVRRPRRSARAAEPAPPARLPKRTREVAPKAAVPIARGSGRETTPCSHALDPRHRPDRPARSRFRRRPLRAHRRDRRRQVDRARRRLARARRARRRRAGARRRGAGAGHGGLRPRGRPPGARARCESRTSPTTAT